MSEPAPDPALAALADPARKAEMRQWMERWKVVGPILDAERWARLRASSDDELKRQSLDVLSLWRPEVAGDDGEAILLQQRTFALLGARERA